jgi:transposase
MTDIDISTDERQLLTDYKNMAPHRLIRAKSEALLLASRHVDIGIVSEFVDREVSTVKEWIRQWRKTRMASVATGHADNLNASKLTADQHQEVLQLLAQPPSDQGLPVQFWTVPHLKNWIHTRFDVIYESASSYHLLLHMAGLSFHHPAPFDQRRATDQQIENRMTEIRSQLAPALANRDHLVFAADEVQLRHEAITRRAWHTEGVKTKLLVDRDRQKQSYIGFLNQHDSTCELHALEWQNKTTIIGALRNLIEDHPGKEISIVWDNAS